MKATIADQNKVPRRSARYAEIIAYLFGFQTFKYGKLGEVIENIRTFALPFENQTYTFRMQYEYDPFNRIQSMLYPDSERVEYGYNLGGMLTKVTGTVTRKTSDLVVPVLLQGGGLLQGGDGVQGLGPGGDHAVENTVTIRYPYLDSIVYNQFELRDSVVYGNGTQVRYVYDSLLRLVTLRSYTADGERMQDIAYTYDSVGNILEVENAAGMLANGLGGGYRQTYTYDNLYRLTNATGWWDCRPNHLILRDTVDMHYSRNGRIAEKRVSAETFNNSHLNLVRYDRQYQYPSDYSNKVNRVTDAISGASHLFAWDGSGNMAHHDDPDQNCDRHLSWTEDNRLQFVKDNGSTGAYYQYDAGGDRTYKLLYHKTTGSLNGVQTDYYTLDDATLYVSPYLVVTPQGYTKHYYAESERITTQLGKNRFAVVDSCVAGDSLVPIKLQYAARAFPTDSFPTPTPQLGYLHSLTNHPNTASSLYFYHPDHLGSASWITNIYGRTIQHLYYLPWGEDFVNQKTTSFSSMYTFSAKEKDAETGYSYFGSRYYSSELSIWLSVDPMAVKYPSLSPYVYCADNPVRLVDPNGDTVIIPNADDRQFIYSLMNEQNRDNYSEEYISIFSILENSKHTYYFISRSYESGMEDEGKFVHLEGSSYSLIFFTKDDNPNVMDRTIGASVFRVLFEETYHAFQFEKSGIVPNSCISEAAAWKFSTLAPGTSLQYNVSKVEWKSTLMGVISKSSISSVALQLKFGFPRTYDSSYFPPLYPRTIIGTKNEIKIFFPAIPNLAF